MKVGDKVRIKKAPPGVFGSFANIGEFGTVIRVNSDFSCYVSGPNLPNGIAGWFPIAGWRWWFPTNNDNDFYLELTEPLIETVDIPGLGKVTLKLKGVTA